MITAREIYETMGQRFDTLKAAVEFREGLIDAFMRDCPGFYEIPLSKRIAFIQRILDNRDTLRNLLNYTDTLAGSSND